jgi:hypothetical protein
MKCLEDFKIYLFLYMFTIQMVNDLNYRYIKNLKQVKNTESPNYNENSDNFLNDSNKGKSTEVLSLNNIINGKVENLKRIQNFHKHYTKVSSLSSYTSSEFSDLVDLDEFATKFKSILCNNDIVENFAYESLDKFSNNEACLITLVPCGDLDDWNLIETSQKRSNLVEKHFNNNNNSMLDMTYHGHWELLSNTNEIIDRLNYLNKRLSQIDLINLLQEKKLGNFGFYTNSKRNEVFNGKHFTRRNYQNNIKLSTCDYLEVTLYDSSKNLLMRKQINRDVFEEIKRNYTNYFNYQEETFIDRQQALDIAHQRLKDMEIKV